MSTFSPETRGTFILSLSAIAFSTAGIFTKAVDAAAWDVIFWRGLSGIFFTLLFLALRSGVKDEIQRFGKPALVATLFMASGTAAFIPAFKYTSVANVALIWATAPFVTALMAWFVIKEAPSLRVILCSALALIGVAITVGGSHFSGNIFGDALAFWMTLMMAATMVLYRAWPNTPTKLPAALSSALLLPFALMLSTPFNVPIHEVWILLAFGLVFAIASVLLAEGASLVPSAKAALISALETPLAPIWAILVLAEWPSLPTVIGGAIILLAITFSQDLKRRSKGHL